MGKDNNIFETSDVPKSRDTRQMDEPQYPIHYYYYNYYNYYYIDLGKYKIIVLLMLIISKTYIIILLSYII